jgi:hypothetical protein
MDHSIAYLMEFTNNPFEIKTIESELTEDNNQLFFQKKSEALINMDQHTLYAYYNKIGEAIKTTNKSVLFWPN